MRKKLQVIIAEKENATMSMTGRIFITSLILAGMLVIPVSHPSAMDGPDVIELDTLSSIYTAVTFDHAMHTDMTPCAACHHQATGVPTQDTKCVSCHAVSRETDEVACSGCHEINPGNGARMKESRTANLYHTDTTGLKRAYHLKCLGCHKEMEAASGCEDCHPKKDIGLKVSQANE